MPTIIHPADEVEFEDNATLIVALVNAAPDLLAAARRVKELEAATVYPVVVEVHMPETEHDLDRSLCAWAEVTPGARFDCRLSSWRPGWKYIGIEFQDQSEAIAFAQRHHPMTADQFDKAQTFCRVVVTGWDERAIAAPAPDVPATDKVEAIRKRHEADEAIDDEDYVMSPDLTVQAQRDRATLLRLLDAARAESRKIREAARPFVPIPDVLSAIQGCHDEDQFFLNGDGWEIGPVTAGDLRRLAAAMKEAG